eukprot:468543-Rhodomonas_salina.2
MCAGTYQFVGFDLGVNGHLHFVWMCAACSWNTNTEVICKGPVPLEQEEKCASPAKDLLALRDFCRPLVAKETVQRPLPAVTHIPIQHPHMQTPAGVGADGGGKDDAGTSSAASQWQNDVEEEAQEDSNVAQSGSLVIDCQQ